MKRLTYCVFALLLAPGCIVLDEITTLSIRPDGSSELVVFHSNVRSTEQGGKAEEELKQFADGFDARTAEDFVRITQAGGEVVDARWIRREVPYSNLVVARFPKSSALEKLGTIQGKEDETRLSTRYTQNGVRRRLTMIVLPPKDFKAADLSDPSPKEARQNQANGLSETRLVFEAGQIVASRGFQVADDRRSALIAVDEIRRLVRENPERIELFIEWEVQTPTPPR